MTQRSSRQLPDLAPPPGGGPDWRIPRREQTFRAEPTTPRGLGVSIVMEADPLSQRVRHDVRISAGSTLGVSHNMSMDVRRARIDEATAEMLRRRITERVEDAILEAVQREIEEFHEERAIEDGRSPFLDRMARPAPGVADALREALMGGLRGPVGVIPPSLTPAEEAELQRAASPAQPRPTAPSEPRQRLLILDED